MTELCPRREARRRPRRTRGPSRSGGDPEGLPRRGRPRNPTLRRPAAPLGRALAGLCSAAHPAAPGAGGLGTGWLTSYFREGLFWSPSPAPLALIFITPQITGLAGLERQAVKFLAVMLMRGDRQLPRGRVDAPERGVPSESILSQRSRAVPPWQNPPLLPAEHFCLFLDTRNQTIISLFKDRSRRAVSPLGLFSCFLSGSLNPERQPDN